MVLSCTFQGLRQQRGEIMLPAAGAPRVQRGGTQAPVRWEGAPSFLLVPLSVPTAYLCLGGFFFP